MVWGLGVEGFETTEGETRPEAGQAGTAGPALDSGLVGPGFRV